MELPVAIAGVNTAILLSSSVTLHWAQTSIKHGNRFGLRAGIVATFLLGATFLFIQINEYVARRLRAARQRPGLDLLRPHRPARRARLHRPDACCRSSRSAPSAATSSPEEHRGVEVPGIYWHFVDVMWVVVYTTIYIL